MTPARIIRFAVSLAFSAILVLDAFAQIPKHPPGSICKTPKFWCWVNPPGTPGAPCSCPTPYGPIAGTLQ